jgi:hypothetical protein
VELRLTSVAIEAPPESTTEGPEELEWLTTAQRCDSCGAQSYYAVEFTSGVLYFCRHHYLKYEAMFFEIAQDIVDESELLKV